MTRARVASDRLDALLAAASQPSTRRYWERYMKGTASFRGVPMAGVRKAVREVWGERALAAWSTDELLALAHTWFARPATEDKLAAVLLLAEQIPERLDLTCVDALAHPFAHGDVSDWGVCDWYATKALHGFVAGGERELADRARAVAGWSSAPGLWQRRAAVVAFVGLAPVAPHPFSGFADLLLAACAANLVCDDRFAHTGPGWLLRELSRVEPDRVATFVEEHPELSREATRMATAHLRPGPYRRR